MFEATHGTAPKYANLDKVNPGSVILSGEMMLRYMGWTEAADMIIKAMDTAIGNKTVTYDFARLIRSTRSTLRDLGLRGGPSANPGLEDLVQPWRSASSASAAWTRRWSSSLDIEPTDRITHAVARHSYAVWGNLARVL